jgi:hypothetical protein
LDGLYFLQFVREINPGWFVFHLFRPAFGRAATVRGQSRVQRLGTAANKNSTRIYFAALRLTNPCCLIALLGYQVELQTIDGRIAEMRRQLGSLTSVPADGASAPQANFEEADDEHRRAETDRRSSTEAVARLQEGPSLAISLGFRSIPAAQK